MRLTTNKNVSDMGMFELAHNCCYIAEDGTGRYRDYEMDMDQRELTRKLMSTLVGEELPLGEESFDEEMMDNLMIDPLEDVQGLIALLYHNMWAMADLREKLKRYEDAEEQGRLLRLPCKVGDSVYRFWYADGKAYKVQTQVIRTLANLVAIMESGEFGKSVFLSLEEAENKLKEMEGNEAQT